METTAAGLIVAPAYGHVPEAYRTDGDQAAGLCADAGYGPDPEQRLALDAIFSRDEHGKSVAFETWLVACRQNLKTGTIKQAVLTWGFLYAEDPIIWTAHKWDPPLAEAFLDLEEIISGYRWMARQVLWMHRGERQQKIALKNGARILFMSRSDDSGRALAGAKTVLDEGWALRNGQMGALLPTMASRSIHGDPQILGGSSAAHARSEVLHAVMRRGRAAAAGGEAARRERRLCYLEWRAPAPEIACGRGRRCSHDLDTPGCGYDKPEMVRLANPAVGRRISMEYILEFERRSMPVGEYGRERMGWEDPPEDGGGTVIPLTEWADSLDEDSEPVGAVMLSVVYARSQRSAAIGLAGVRADRRWHVEVADEVPPSRLAVRVRVLIARGEMSGRRVAQPVAIDGNAFEKACIPLLENDLPFEAAMASLPPLEARRLADLEEHWPLSVKVERMYTGDVVAAFTGFRDCLTEARNLRHRGQDNLTLALAGACSRTVGDAGEAWGRRKSQADIECIVSVTQARWIHERDCPVAEVEPGVWSM